MNVPGARAPRRLPSGPAAAAHLAALSGVAVAQPLFDLLSRQAELFVAHDARPIDLVWVAVLPSVALPAALWLLARSAGWLVRPAGLWTHLAAVAGLSGLLALQVVERVAPEMPGSAILAAAGLLAAASAACYRRYRAVRTFLTFVAPAALLFPALFLLRSPVRQMLLPADAAWNGERAEAASVPVVMVVLDELPVSSLLDASGEVDPVRYPHFAALAEDAYWFRDATTVAYGTTLSVPIILSGRVPERLELPLAEHYPDNLFTWLAAAGYQLKVFETHTSICPRELCSREVTRRGFAARFDAITTDLLVIYLHLLLPADLAAPLPAIDATWHHFTNRTIGTRLKQLLGKAPDSPTSPRRDNPWLFAAFLDSIDRGHQPALHFIHLMLPHLPWKYLPSGKEYGPVGAPILPHGLVKETWGADRWEVVQGFQRYLLQLGYVDALIGRLLAKLEQEDLYDPALVVVVADHGASFRPRASRRGPTARHFADVLNVPLFVKLPYQEQGVISDRNVETIDVLPTIADVLDLPLPWPVDGQSAIDPGAPERPVKLTLEAAREDGFDRRTWEVEALRSDRARSVERKLRLFGSGGRPEGLFRIGRRAALVGRRVAEIGVVQTAETSEAIEVELDQAFAYEDVDPAGPFVPAHVTGQARFAQPGSAAAELAIAVNGTIEAVTRTFGHDGRSARFTAMVREEALVEGRNLVEVFEIRGGRKAPSLVPTRRSGGAEYTLVEVAGKAAIQARDGRRIPLVEGHLVGAAKIRRTPIGTRLAGWAATGAGQPPAETLLVFVDGRLAYVTDNGLPPDDARGRSMDDWHRRASFEIQLPDALVAGSGELRLIAVSGDAASEIDLR